MPRACCVARIGGLRREVITQAKKDVPVADLNGAEPLVEQLEGAVDSRPADNSWIGVVEFMQDFLGLEMPAAFAQQQVDHCFARLRQF